MASKVSLMDASKLLRKPFLVKRWDQSEEVTFVPSPDKKYKIAFSHFVEERMGSYRGLFSLLDESDNIIDGFEPVTTFTDKMCYWNSDSNIFVLPTADFNYGYLLVKVADLSISFLKLANPYPTILHFKNDVLVVSYDEYQLSLRNSIQTFGGGPLEIPSKVYLKPPDIEIPLKELTFFSRKKLGKLEELTKSAREFRLDPIDGRFREFKGVFPQSTKQVYNTRQLEVYQLEAFAEYGDEQSAKWLNAIKDKTVDKYNKWEKVANYLGLQQRGG
jgi:hypothetical protein